MIVKRFIQSDVPMRANYTSARLTTGAIFPSILITWLQWNIIRATGMSIFLFIPDRGGIKIQLTDSVAVKTSKSDSRILRRIDYASVLTEEERKTFEGRIREITDENWKSECK